MTEDVYTLREWATNESLKAHNTAALCNDWHLKQLFTEREKAMNEIIKQIESMRRVELHRTLIPDVSNHV